MESVDDVVEAITRPRRYTANRIACRFFQWLYFDWLPTQWKPRVVAVYGTKEFLVDRCGQRSRSWLEQGFEMPFCLIHALGHSLGFEYGQIEKLIKERLYRDRFPTEPPEKETHWPGM